MSETITTKPNGNTIPLDSLEQHFTYNGTKLAYITTEYPPGSGITYRQTFTYYPGFAIDSVTVNTAGSFRTVNISTTGSGEGAVFAPVFALLTPNIGAGGSGYTIGDTLTVIGGVGTAAQVQVTALGAGGSIATVVVTVPGSYTTLPVGNVDVSGGTGTGAKLDPYYKFLSIGVTSGGAGYDGSSVMTFAGDIITPPAATLNLSTIDTGGEVQTITAWEQQ